MTDMLLGLAVLMAIYGAGLVVLWRVEERQRRRDEARRSRAEGMRPPRLHCGLCDRPVDCHPSTHFRLFHDPRRPTGVEDRLPDGWRADDWDA